MRSIVWMIATVVAGCGSSPSPSHTPDAGNVDTPSGPVELHCSAASCPEVLIAGDPHAATSFRGYGDPSLERDADGTLWLAYSWLDEQPLTGTPLHAVRTHLARSDDGGASFAFVRAVNAVAPAPGDVALVIHEVSTLARRPDGRWHLAWLTYGLTAAGDRAQFHYQRAVADAPAGLGDAIDPWLRGTATTVPTQLDATAIAGAEACLAFTEPALFTHAGESYLATTCIVNPADPATQRLLLLREAGSTLVLVGELLTSADAAELGATRVEQIDLAIARDGAVLAIVTPIDDRATVPHRGCVVLEVADLARAELRRDDAGRLVRRAVITADGNGIGPGLCTYDRDAATGILIDLVTVGTGSDPDIVFSLRATGLHP